MQVRCGVNAPHALGGVCFFEEFPYNGVRVFESLVESGSLTIPVRLPDAFVRARCVSECHRTARSFVFVYPKNS